MFFRLVLVLALVNLTACSMFHKRRGPDQDMTVTLKDKDGNVVKEASDSKAAVAPAATPTTAESKPATHVAPDAKAEADAKKEATEMKTAVAAAADKIAKSGKPERKVGPVPADQSLGWLKHGNERFVKGFFRKDGASKKDVARLSQGQAPHAVILSCSDSRVPPEVVFDQKLGEVFVVRTAGEALDNNVVGSIEYAVDSLGANLIVVMGHDSCGAVSAALSSLQGAQFSPAINGLVADIKPRVQKFVSHPASEGLLEESWANVDGIAKDLLVRSEILRDAATSGEVKIVRAMYSLDSGKVSWK